MKKAALLTIFAVFLVLLIGSSTYGMKRSPYNAGYDPSTAWSGLDITFKTESAAEGTQTWRYRRDNEGQWRLDTLSGRGTENAQVFAKDMYYKYDKTANHLVEVPYSHRVEASYLLRPDLAIVLSNEEQWKVVGNTKVKGMDVTELVSKDETERFWIRPDIGLPVKYTTSEMTWELLTVQQGRQHQAADFAAPQAGRVDRLDPAPRP